jgi:hypothetical protein
MKKSTLLVAVVLFSVIFMSFALAQDRKAPAKDKDETKTGMMNKQEMGKPGMMNKKEMGETGMMGSNDMCGTMMGSMMGHCMVASGDGGVIVMMGDKLMKYDRDLNLVKEVEVAIDMEHMSARMAQMMAMCPMHKNMMQGRGMESNEKNMKQ